MESKMYISLTAAEISNLWTQYQNDTLALCVNSYMHNLIEDDSIRSIFEYALSLSLDNIRQISEFLMKEKFPIPIGFTPQDVNLEAPRLYSDALCLKYLHEITIHGMSSYSIALTTSTRQDIRNFYWSCGNNVNKLYGMTTDLLLSKGLYHRPPYINAPQEAMEFIKNNHFLTGYSSPERTLNAIEINNIFFNLKKSMITKAMILSFSQTAQSQEVRKFFVKAAAVKSKHIKIFSDILTADNLSAPPSWDSDVTDSTTPPFSDKLMLFLTGFLFSTAIGYYGAGLATSLRTDLVKNYTKIIPENISIGKRWFDLMVKNQWFEEPPQANDRKELARV